jgi:nitrate reductase gamma subunit
MKLSARTVLLVVGILLLFSHEASSREDYGAMLEQDCEVCHLDRYYPGGDFMEAEDNYKWKIFWGMTAIAGIIFIVGMINTIALWRLGKSKSIKGKVRWGPALKAILTEVILEKRIFKKSFIRWSVFFGISMGFVFLFIAFLAFIAFKLSTGIDFIEPSSFQLTLDLFLDFFGVLIMVGILLAILRRYVVRSPQMENLTQDTVAVVFIFLIILSGFLLEGFRFATLPTSSAIKFSFMGSIIGSWFRGFEFPWTVYHFYLWLFHGFISLAFVAYIPFGKIRHFFACPISIAATASDEANFEKE